VLRQEGLQGLHSSHSSPQKKAFMISDCPFAGWNFFAYRVAKLESRELSSDFLTIIYSVMLSPNLKMDVHKIREGNPSCGVHALNLPVVATGDCIKATHSARRRASHEQVLIKILCHGFSVSELITKHLLTGVTTTYMVNRICHSLLFSSAVSPFDHGFMTPYSVEAIC
jgi:hypothetical protein